MGCSVLSAYGLWFGAANRMFICQHARGCARFANFGRCLVSRLMCEVIIPSFDAGDWFRRDIMFCLTGVPIVIVVVFTRPDKGIRPLFATTPLEI